MKWKRYIIFSIIIVVSFIYIIFLNKEIQENNNKVFQITEGLDEALINKVRLEENLNYKAKVSKEIIYNKMETIIKGLLSKDIIKQDFFQEHEMVLSKYLEDIKYKNIDSDLLKMEISRYTESIENRRNSLIQKIIKDKNRRDFLVILTLLVFIIALLIELILIMRMNKKVQNYLNNFALKNYDFSIKDSNIPYFNPAVSEMKKLKGSLRVMDEAINVTLKGYSVKDTLKEIFNNKKFKKYLNFDRIGFASIDNGYIIASVGYSNTKIIKLKKGFRIQVKESDSLMQIIESGEARIISDLEKYLKENPDSKSTNLLIDEGYKSSLTAPIYNRNSEVVGFLFFSSKEKKAFTENDKHKISSITDILSYILSRNMLIDDLTANTSLAFVKLVEGKDPETVNHLDRMSLYTKNIAEILSENDKYKDYLDYHLIEDIYKFAPLHDIGKVGIPDNILLKPGKLDNDEFEIMKKHAEIGAEVLINFEKNLEKYDSDFFKTGIKIAKYHHERWDGKGYPEGLKGENIPLEARIVSVADVFDALTSKRIYKEAMAFEKSVAIIKEMSGENFDPEIVEAFEKSIPSIKIIYEKLKEI